MTRSLEEGSKTSRCPSADPSALHLRPALRRVTFCGSSTSRRGWPFFPLRPEPSGHVTLHCLTLRLDLVTLTSRNLRVQSSGSLFRAFVAYRTFFSFGRRLSTPVHRRY